MRINPHCPTGLASLGDSECELEDRAGADMSARISEVCSVCVLYENWKMQFAQPEQCVFLPEG